LYNDQTKDPVRSLLFFFGLREKTGISK